MQLISLSISHHNTPVELRECISLSPEAVAEAYARFPARKAPYQDILELALLSTCNRLEVYALVAAPEGTQDDASLPAFAPVRAYLGEALQIPTLQVDFYFREYSGVQAARHLFQVASGLDSIAIGETQILGQVTRALETAMQAGSARHVLSSLFRAAIHAGKRVRAETEIGRRPTNLSILAAQLAEQRLGGLAGRSILVIGAGEMGGYTLAALQALGADRVTLTNRTFDHAAALAERFGAALLEYENLPGGLADADLVFTSTAAPLPILRRELVARAMQRRAHRPLTIVDLAVPRNTEAQVADIPNVTVLNMDDLQSFARNARISSHQEIARAQAIVDEEAAQYDKLLQIIPFIGELHKKVENIRQREVERALRRLHDPAPEVVEQLELLSRSLVRKVLHEPTKHLRTETDPTTLNEYVDNLARLFDLSEHPPEIYTKDSPWNED